MKLYAIIAVAIFALLALWGISVNNSIERKDEAVDASFAQVDTVLQRRFDLIPNLVNTVKGYAKHEEGVFKAVTEARSQWSAAKTPEEKMAASAAMDKALVNVKAVTENYPTLKADRNFLELQSQLEGTENRIAVERRNYTQVVQAYNSYIRVFPNSMIAGFKGVQKRKTFEADSTARNSVKVEF